MKKKSLLLVLLMAILAPLAMNGQTTNQLLKQNFDGNGFSITDNTYDARAWYTYNAGSGNNWSLYQHGSSSAHSGNYDVRYSYTSAYAANCYLVSEPFSVSANMTQLSVSLYEKVESSTYAEIFEVFFVKANDVTTLDAVASATQYSAIASASYSNESWAEQSNTITNTALAGQSLRLVVHCTSEKDKYRLYIDDITVTETVLLTDPYIVLDPTSATVLTGFTETLTASYGNVTGTPTITYTSSNTNVATVSGSGTTATVTGVSAGTATITAMMNGSYTATCAITVEDPSYCTPGTGNWDGNGIYNVTFGSNPSVNNTVAGIAYGDYSNLVGAVNAGATCQVDITYKTGCTYGTIIWVDWNRNYTFEGTEAVYAGTSSSSNPTTLNATFTVPLTTLVGDYRMRIIGSDMGLDSYTGSLSAAANADPCGTYDWSTCHDYTLRVSSDPYIALDPTSAMVFTGFTETLTASYGNVTGTPTITYTTSDATVASVIGSGTTATVTGIAPGTATITASMTYNGNTYTAQCAITVEAPHYCTPNPSSRDGKGITTLTFGSGNYTVNNSDSNGLPNSSPYYADYTSMVGGYEPGETATVTITYSTGTSTVYSYGTLIWVDWNKNYTFEDSEIVYTGTSAQGSGGTPQVLTATFTVPANQAADDYRMRVAGADSYFDDYIGGSSSADHDPCFSSTYAVCHDYTLRVVALGAYTITCATTTGGTISADKTTADEDDVVTITATPETDYLLTALTYTPEGGSAQSINIASTPYTFTMPAANVTVNATFSLPACPRPTNLTVGNLAASHATVSWDSEAGNYTVKYSTATVTGTTLDPVFEDGFENGLTGWTTYAVGNYTGSGYVWQQVLGSNFSGTSAHNGSYVAMSRSYGGDEDQSVDNWLVTPQMTLGDVVKFWVCGDDADWQEYFTVHVSTGTNAISDFVQIATPELAPGDGTWAERTVDLSAYAGQQGYVAIRHTDEGKDYLFVDDFGVYNTINTYSYGGWTTVSPNPTTESCQITGLSAETLYEVQVQANCGGSDGSSAWSIVRFTTPDNCGAPQELASSNVTATSATLSWADDKDSYNLQYRKVYFYEGFEGGTLPTGWTTIDANNDGLTWSVGHSTAHSGHNGAYNVSYVYSSDGSITTTPDDYLVSPLLDLQGTLRVWLSGYPRQSSNYSEHFAIYISTNGNTASDFTTTLVGETTTTSSYVEYTASLSQYEGQQGYIAIRHFNCSDQYYLYVDDFGLYGSENWVTLNPNPTTETANLTGLSMNTTYEWQVQGVNCDGNGGTSDWSDMATFTTPEQYTITINGYGTSQEAINGKAGYYLIASPIGQVDPRQVANLIKDPSNIQSDGYDLYYFDQTRELEWVNYKAAVGQYDLMPGKGYLYANSETVDLVFTGAAYSGNGEVQLTYSENNEDERMHGWNLIGNPFPMDAYLTDRTFYVMNSNRTDLTVSNGTKVGAMEGVFVHAEDASDTSVTFSTEAPTRSESSRVVINVAGVEGGVIDRAIVDLGEGRTLPKFMIDDSNTKLYIPQDGGEYAVARGNGGSMAVNFHASRMGEYTISVEAEGIGGYLHLVDLLTGNDIDLTRENSYTFIGAPSDAEGRFILRFSSESASGDFAYQSGSDIIVSGDGMLQVFDVLGRFVSSHEIHGVQAVPAMTTGVYIFRMIGEDVRTQKIVVR